MNKKMGFMGIGFTFTFAGISLASRLLPEQLVGWISLICIVVGVIFLSISIGLLDHK